jgi:hypothetical protein
MCYANCCSFCAIDFENIALLCHGKDECLCLVREACLDVNQESLGLGMVTNEDNNEVCKIGCVICTMGLKTPDKLFSGANRFLCIKSAQSCPFDDDFVKAFVCAYCGCQCAPECGCCGESGTECPALDRPMNDYKTAPAAVTMDGR